MAEGDDSEEKSQEPTEKRKDDARKDGQVLTSKEAFVFASMAAGTGLLALSAAFGLYAFVITKKNRVITK